MSSITLVFAGGSRESARRGGGRLGAERRQDQPRVRRGNELHRGGDQRGAQDVRAGHQFRQEVHEGLRGKFQIFEILYQILCMQASIFVKTDSPRLTREEGHAGPLPDIRLSLLRGLLSGTGEVQSGEIFEGQRQEFGPG